MELQRLGIAMHVYADTWSHQGFCGVRDLVHDASDLRWADGTVAASSRDRVASWFVSRALPLGHGTVLSLQDRPYARWSYVDGLGNRIERDNPADFLMAAGRMVRWIRRWTLRDADEDVAGVGEEDTEVLRELIAHEAEVDERHAMWRAAAALGRFSSGRAEIAYAGRGPASWKHAALGLDDVDAAVPLTPDFFRSPWKAFHDALLEHQFQVLHEILPRYGVLAD